VDAHKTVPTSTTPGGSVCWVQVDPPLVVPVMPFVVDPVSVASHALMDGQTMSPIDDAPEGAVCEAHVDPLVVVRRMTGAPFTSPPVASQTVADGQDM
jgi:hypothetical protein